MVKIIAEIGCNHNGDFRLAKSMVEQAKKCGADAVKFQVFKSEELISKFAPKAEYQIKNTGKKETQLEMTKKLELSYDDYRKLFNFCKKIEIEAFATAFDFDSVDFLVEMKQKIWKIPSGEINNIPFLEYISNKIGSECTVLLSTGMANLVEISEAINSLEKYSKPKICILHCNTEYPTVDEEVNLRAITTLKNQFSNCDVGFSDHSCGILAAEMSVILGASVIEKHFTLDKTFEGPDHKASIEPFELEELCRNIKRCCLMLGTGEKKVSESERKNILIARRSIVAKKDIKKGEVFSVENITCKRPGIGISPIYFDDMLGRIASQDFCEDELIVDKEHKWQND